RQLTPAEPCLAGRHEYVRIVKRNINRGFEPAGNEHKLVIDASRRIGTFWRGHHGKCGDVGEINTGAAAGLIDRNIEVTRTRRLQHTALDRRENTALPIARRNIDPQPSWRHD